LVRRAERERRTRKVEFRVGGSGAREPDAGCHRHERRQALKRTLSLRESAARSGGCSVARGKMRQYARVVNAAQSSFSSCKSGVVRVVVRQAVWCCAAGVWRVAVC